MATEKRLIYLEDAIAVLEKDVADGKDALKTAYCEDKAVIQAEMNGVRAAIHLLKHHASHGGTVDAVAVEDKKLLKAIKMMIKQYEHSKNSEYVHSPVAHAFFHTWKQLDERRE